MARKKSSRKKERIRAKKATAAPKEEAKRVLEQYNVKAEDLPIILESDPAIKKFGAERNDIIKIERNSFTIGKAVYYRAVK